MQEMEGLLKPQKMSASLSEAVERYRGNWEKFESFAWFSQPADAGNWAILDLYHRDSPLIDRHNGQQVQRRMGKFFDAGRDGKNGDAFYWDAAHWAVGYTKGVAVRVVGVDGMPTKAFRALHKMMQWLESHEVLAPAVYGKAIAREIRANIDFLIDQCLPDGVRAHKQPLSKVCRNKLLKELHRVDTFWDDDLDEQGVPCPNVDTLVQAMRNLDLIDDVSAA